MPKKAGKEKWKKKRCQEYMILIEIEPCAAESRYAKKIIKENNCMSNANIAPGTKVFKLVEELARYLPEEIRGKFIN